MSGVKMTVMRVYNIDAYRQPQFRTAGAVGWTLPCGKRQKLVTAHR